MRHPRSSCHWKSGVTKRKPKNLLKSNSSFQVNKNINVNTRALREAAIRQATVATELLGRTQEAEQVSLVPCCEFYVLIVAL